MIYDGVTLGNGATVTVVLICFTSHEGNIEVESLGCLREASSQKIWLALASSQGQNLDSEQPNGKRDALASSQGQDLDSEQPRSSSSRTETTARTRNCSRSFHRASQILTATRDAMSTVLSGVFPLMTPFDSFG